MKKTIQPKKFSFENFAFETDFSSHTNSSTEEIASHQFGEILQKNFKDEKNESLILVLKYNDSKVKFLRCQY